MDALIEKMNDKYRNEDGLRKSPISEEKLTDYAESYNKFKESRDTQQCCKDKHCDAKYGICGTVAPMYVDNDKDKEKLYNGGAPQYNTPGSIRIFTRIGVFREYKKK